MALGGKGVISVISNLMPRETHELVAAALEGDFARAREIHFQIAAADARAVPGNQPDSAEAGAGVHGQVQRRAQDAAHADVSGGGRAAASRDERVAARIARLSDGSGPRPGLRPVVTGQFENEEDVADALQRSEHIDLLQELQFLVG